MMKCWENDPDERPTFTDLKSQLRDMQNQHRVRQKHIVFNFAVNRERSYPHFPPLSRAWSASLREQRLVIEPRTSTEPYEAINYSAIFLGSS